MRMIILASNRRVDITLSNFGQAAGVGARVSLQRGGFTDASQGRANEENHQPGSQEKGKAEGSSVS